MNLFATDNAGSPRGASLSRVYQTTLLDLLVGIDELTAGDDDRVATARRLLGGGRIKLISRPSELSDSSLLPRTRLRDLLAEVSKAG